MSISGFWTTSGTPSGDQQSSYSQADFADAYRILSACAGFEGVAPGFLNELACTDGGSETVAVNTGGAMVDGKWFLNDASQNVTVAAAVGSGNTRIDRIVLRASWAGFNVSVHRIAGTDAATPTAPAITQTSETTYDIQLCRVLVDTSGNVTVTDERVWAGVSANGIKANAVTTAKIADSAVTNSKIVNDAINQAKIASGAVIEAKIASNAVTPVKTNIFPANANAKIYVGHVNADGSAVRLPSGWSSSKGLTGNYTITHNLGTTNYIIVASGQYAVGSVPNVSFGTLGSNSVAAVTNNIDGTTVDRPFMFTLIRY